jgi:carboxyl-terminal processing protease
MLSGDIGYVRLATFGADVAPKLQSQIGELSKAGAKRLLIDIRNTAEGDFSRGIDASRLFVKSGTLAMVAGRSADAKPTDTPSDKAEKVPQSAIKETIAAKTGDGAIDLPVTLLVTTGTSGAAEVFASALEGNKRADSIGERTLGRAGIQKLVRLPEGRGLWLTSERYVSPGGELIQGRGLTPDTGVDQPDLPDFDQPKPATDPILDAALARLQKKAA